MKKVFDLKVVVDVEEAGEGTRGGLSILSVSSNGVDVQARELGFETAFTIIERGDMDITLTCGDH